MAIGVFATVGDAESVLARLTTLGITHFERLPADQATREAPDQSANDTVTVRIYLQTPDEEQLVATTLLDSAARSVLLHDVDPAD